MGDLLLENPSVRGDEDGADDIDLNEDQEQKQVQRHERGSQHLLGQKQGDDRGGRGHAKHKEKKKHQAAMTGEVQADESRDLPDGRYRLVVKVLKPWGVRGRATDVERWSSPIIVIKRNK
ncbi:hypothetical protein BG000_009907 [Podila horticola]|nr:hypothetical protein BG000_009907 [Podila horticola]